MLSELGFTDIDCYYHTFCHPMASPAEVVEWCRATALRPYLDRIPDDRQAEFTSQLIARLEAAYGTRKSLMFDFRRLFLWARRPSR
jgi:trans-aconitate 2-methyltransferase